MADIPSKRYFIPAVIFTLLSIFYFLMSSGRLSGANEPVSINPSRKNLVISKKGIAYADDRIIVRVLKKNGRETREGTFQNRPFNTGDISTKKDVSYYVKSKNKNLTEYYKFSARSNVDIKLISPIPGSVSEKSEEKSDDTRNPAPPAAAGPNGNSSLNAASQTNKTALERKVDRSNQLKDILIQKWVKIKDRLTKSDQAVNNNHQKVVNNITERSTKMPTPVPTTHPKLNVKPLRPTARPDTCNDCFQRPYTFTINSPEVCYGLKMDPDGKPTLSLLIIITTTAEQLVRRDGIRQTWAGLTVKNAHPNVRYVFLLGYSTDENHVKLIEEREKYKDIALQNFTDAYSNLTLKTLMGFEWAESFCPGAKYIMKTDDDMYVNVHNILKYLQDAKPEGLVVGYCHLMATPHRHLTSKWYVSKMQYPHSKYPGFCSGTGYVTSRKVAFDILHISPTIPFFYLEDVYVALCVDRLGYKLKSHPGFHSDKPLVSAKHCGFYKTSLFTSHGVVPPKLQEIWGSCGPKKL